MNVSEYIAERMSKEVDKVFSVVGGGSMYLNEAFRDLAVYMHHEQACSMAAEAYARIHGLGVCVVTTGPGGTNAITGVMGAYQDSIPMIIISGQVRTEMMSEGLRQRGDQEADIVSMVRPITKWAVTIIDPKEIPDAIDSALYVATHGRPGPVWLDIPLDVQRADIIPETHIAVDAILRAQRPLLLIGSGCSWDNTLRKLDRIKVPVVCAFNAVDRLYEDHPLYVGNTSVIGQQWANQAVDDADTIIVVGCRLNPRQVGYGNWCSNARIIHVDIDQGELDKMTRTTAICADANLFLRSLADAMDGIDLDISDWSLYLKNLNREYGHGIYSDLDDIPLKVGDTIVLANGTASVAGVHALGLKPSSRMITNSGTAAMGYGLSAAIGAFYAGSKRVICIEGDGSLMMNLQELATMSQTEVKLIVINNGGYLSIRQTQDNYKFHRAGETPHMPSFKAVAESFGIPYSNDVNDVAVDGPIMIELFMDPEEKFLPKWEFK
jgi:acetolactate synthase-1/2/3 large subunit